MRDPRIGAIGATGLFLSLLLRYAAILSLPEPVRLAALLFMPAMGRWAMVTGAYGAPYARTAGGLAAPFLSHLLARHVVSATVVLGCLLAWAFGPIPALAMLMIGSTLSRLITMLCRHYLGGITGDTLGATNEVVEVCFLLVVPVLSRV
jgi:adenosylcobinamide-GDP ribazoletransferase